jgi:hypothetical protein
MVAQRLDMSEHDPVTELHLVGDGLAVEGVPVGANRLGW